MTAKNIWSIIDQIEIGGEKTNGKWSLTAKFSGKTMKNILNEMVGMINFIIATDDDLCRKINANIYFDIRLGEGETIQHILRITSHRNKTKNKPREVTMEVDPITFILLLSGKIEGAMAFMSGAIKFVGSADLPLAIQMQQVLGEKLDALRSGQLMNELKASL